MTSPAPAPVTNNVAQPTQGKERIQILDLVRGVAILGILAVNADGFAAPQSASLRPTMWLYPNEGWTAISYWIMDTFFHEKFVTIFSMLFGVSLFLVGGDGKDPRKGRLLARRLAVLLLFGMLHGFGIWWGDILSLYAVTGFLMFLCRSWQPKMLMGIGAALYAVIALSAIPTAAYPFASPAVRAEAEAAHIPDPAAVTRSKARTLERMAEAKGSWAGAYRLNTKAYVNVLSGYPWLIPQTLALMMVGLSLFKSGFLAGRSSTRRYLVAVATGSVALVLVAWLTWQADVRERPMLGGEGFNLLLTPLVALAYIAGLALLQRGGAGKLLSSLAATGRMAFTNYLTQSLLMTSIFYGGRGALMGEVDRPGLWAITIGVWILQLIWSPLWLARFEMGPLEWVWRCFTLGRRIPLRKVWRG